MFLGITTAIGTRKNPLDFITRKVMIENKFGKSISIVLPLPDVKNDGIWSYRIDQKISEVFGHDEATLYGSRDSFIPFYAGKHQICELEPESYISATDSLLTLLGWFSEEDILRLQEHGFYIHIYKSEDYWFYEPFQHFVINQKHSKIIKRIEL